MKRILAVFAMTALGIGLLGLPALATHDGLPDAGAIVSALAEVRKDPTIMCRDDGTWNKDAPGSPGIGLPIVDGTKHAKYRISGRIETLRHGPGDFKVCGNLAPVLDNLLRPAGGGIGAACGMSKGYNGKGEVVWDNSALGVSRVRDVEWKWSAASGFIITGKLDGDLLAGVVSAKNVGTQCVDKTPPGTSPKTGGAGSFLVDVALVSDPNAPAAKLNDLPGSGQGSNDNPATCKGTTDLNGNPADGKEYKCPYKTKPKAK